ncbi:MAG: glutaredoxin [Candidatus Latescibacterota bacterium]|jgi:glutaredoxin
MSNSSSLPRVTLYSKPDCHLCEIAKERIASVRRCVAFELETVDITSDPVLYARYRERIPVVLLEGKEVFAYRVSEKILTQKLREMTPQQSLWARFWWRQ